MHLCTSLFNLSPSILSSSLASAKILIDLLLPVLSYPMFYLTCSLLLIHLKSEVFRCNMLLHACFIHVDASFLSEEVDALMGTSITACTSDCFC